MAQNNELLTIGQISEKLQEPFARVQYIVQKHRIKEIRRVGIIRMFSPEQVELIKGYLYNIQVRGNHHG